MDKIQTKINEAAGVGELSEEAKKQLEDDLVLPDILLEEIALEKRTSSEYNEEIIAKDDVNETLPTSSPIDEAWEKIQKEEIEDKPPPSVLDFNMNVTEEKSPYQRGAISKEKSPVQDQIIPRSKPNKQNNTILNAFIYDVLLEKYSFHKALVQEYYLRKLLNENEILMQKTASPEYLKSALLCVQIHFNFADYEKADQILKQIIKKFPKQKDVLYWKALLAFYSYHYGKQKASPSKSVLTKVEDLLLEVAMNRFNEPKKNSQDIMIYWALLVLSLDMLYTFPKLKMKPKNIPEAYSSEIKKIDDYLGYIAWTDIFSYTKLQQKIDDAKDVLWELIVKDVNRPEAYCRLFTIYLREKKIEKCLDICERLFFEANEFDDNEYLSVIVILYVKCAFLKNVPLLTFHKLQIQYSMHPTQPFFLYLKSRQNFPMFKIFEIS